MSGRPKTLALAQRKHVEPDAAILETYLSGASQRQCATAFGMTTANAWRIIIVAQRDAGKDDRLSTRTNNCVMDLVGSHEWSAADLASYGLSDLRRVHNMGAKSVEELVGWLSRRGVHLSEHGPPRTPRTPYLKQMG